MSNIESNDEFYLRQLEKHHDRSKKKKEDSVKRFDVLMISLSVLGLGFISSYNEDVCTCQLFYPHLAQGFFIGGIITITFSHVASIWANRRAEKSAELDLRFERGDYFLLKEINNESSNEKIIKLEGIRDVKIKKHAIESNKIDCWLPLLNKSIKALNVLSFVLLSAGLICILKFL